MIERNEQGITQLADQCNDPYAVYFYTPLCGTCKVTTRMLEIIETIHPAHRIHKANINFMPQLIQQWQIQSVPCIIILSKGEVLETIYAAQSVQYLQERLQIVIG